MGAVTPEGGARADSSDDLVPESGSDSDDDFLRAVAHAPSLSPEPPPAEEAELTQLAHFRLNGKLGRGGMGIVYRAYDEKLDREIALKVLPGNFAEDPPRQRRFMREARLAASIAHPNVATVHEIGEASGRIYIAMELVSGTTLRRHIEAGKVPVPEAVRITKEIARGVAKAHARGIAHRDLKPDNVMVGPDGAVKVLDFGLAKPTEVSPEPQAAEPATLTQEGRIIGTPGYMSPEQATGRPLDVRTDVFSLGVVLYEMLAGKRPFVGETSMDIVIATSRDPAPPLTNVPADLAKLVDRCLRKDPEERYANADAVLAALDAVRATPDPTPARRLMMIAGALAVAIVAVALGVRSTRAPSEQTPAPLAAPTTLSVVEEAKPSTTTAPNVFAQSPRSGRSADTSTGPEGTLVNPPTSPAAVTMPVKPRAPTLVAKNNAVAPAVAADAGASAPPRGGGVISTSPY
jgi:serine/threonine-protein kinase